MGAKDSATLKDEIKDLEQKRDRLREDLQAAQQAHAAARDAVVQVGDQAALAAVTSAHSRVSALAAALATLEDQITAQQEEFQRAAESERQANARAEIVAGEKRREQARLDYLLARERANAALEAPMQAMLQARKRYSEETREIDSLRASLGHKQVLTERLTDRFSIPRLMPYGLEVDMAYTRTVNMAQKEEEERIRQLQREREQARKDKAAATA